MSIFDSELMNDQTVDCVFMNKAIVADEYGGYTTKWTDGAPFEAVITEEASTQSIVAGIELSTSFFGVKTRREVPIDFGTVFKRVKDGQTFRIRSSTGMSTPSISAMDIKILNAEKYELVEG